MSIFKKVHPEDRKYIIGGIVILAVIAAYTLLIPSTRDYLVDHSWCIDSISYKGKKLQPKTLGVSVSGRYFCDEKILFQESGQITFPGFMTTAPMGRYRVIGDSLYIHRSDIFDTIYQRNYRIKVNSKKMILTSDKTTISCSSINASSPKIIP